MRKSNFYIFKSLFTTSFENKMISPPRRLRKMFLVLMSVIFCSILILSCGGDEIPPPVYNLKAEAQIGNIGPYGVVICPNPGNDCASLYPYAQDNRILLDEFMRMYNHDSINYFFTYKNWQKIFPSLQRERMLVDSLRNGLYTIGFDKAGNILVRHPLNALDRQAEFMAAMRYTFLISPDK
ncbi:MAG: hypothetical protein FJ340_04310 [Sphingomonadales bacterium]|nr:hypothetical protein [Sphingomonadales bacterium]